MMRVWCSLALLSASWMFGVTYYHDAVLWIWFLLVVIGSVLLWGIPMPRLSTDQGDVRYYCFRRSSCCRGPTGQDPCWRAWACYWLCPLHPGGGPEHVAPHA